MTFNYTHSDTDIESSLVYEAYYNADTRELALVLDGGWGYAYFDVDKSIFDQIEEGYSAGKIYNTEIKGSHSGRLLGYVGYDNEREFVPVAKTPTFATVGTPKNLTYAPGAKVTSGTVVGDTLIPLGNTPTNSIGRKHTVVFDANGSERRHTLNAANADAAVEAILEIAEILDVDFSVKEVVTHYR